MEKSFRNKKKISFLEVFCQWMFRLCPQYNKPQTNSGTVDINVFEGSTLITDHVISAVQEKRDTSLHHGQFPEADS